MSNLLTAKTFNDLTEHRCAACFMAAMLHNCVI